MIENMSDLRNVFEVTKKIRDLKVGDSVDLYGDQYADPNKDDQKPFAFMYETVEEVKQETTNCIRVVFCTITCGFPPDHEVQVFNDDKEWKLST